MLLLLFIISCLRANVEIENFANYIRVDICVVYLHHTKYIYMRIYLFIHRETFVNNVGKFICLKVCLFTFTKSFLFFTRGIFKDKKNYFFFGFL